MKLPRERPAVSPRTLDSLQSDLLLFQTAGNGDLKQAKRYNNVISQHFFKFLLTQLNILIETYTIHRLSARASQLARSWT